MAIPDSPNWSTLTEIGRYPKYPLKTPSVLGGVSSIALGPKVLNDSQGTLIDNYWAVYQENDNVLIQLYDQSLEVWTDLFILFTETEVIKEISLTFDQLGRPLVFYNTNSDTLKIYWYNPLLEENVIESIAVGANPVSCFDYPQNTDRPFSDILLFYVKDNSIYMRVQRDRFTIEYPTGVTHLGIVLESAGLRVDNRLQLIYSYPGV